MCDIRFGDKLSPGLDGHQKVMKIPEVNIFHIPHFTYHITFQIYFKLCRFLPLAFEMLLILFWILQLLGHILSFLRVRELLVCRQVSRRWNTASIYNLKKRRQLSVSIYDAAKEIGIGSIRLLRIEIPAHRNLISYVRCLLKSQEMSLLPANWLGFVKLRVLLYSDFARNDVLLEDEKGALHDAWRTIAKHVTHVTIIKKLEFSGQFDGHPAVSYRSVLPDGISFDKIRNIGVYNEFYWDTSELPAFVHEIVSRSPFLEKLILYRIMPHTFQQYVNHVANLTSLEWKIAGSVVGNNDVFCPKQISTLKHLLVDRRSYFSGNLPPLTIQNFIKQQSIGLKRLVLLFCKDVDLRKLTFPNLATLVLQYNCDGICNEYEQKNDSFPLLNRLELVNMKELDRDIVNFHTFNSVRELVINKLKNRSYQKIGLVMSQQIFKKFPCVTSLEISAWTDNIVYLVGNAPTVTSLTLFTSTTESYSTHSLVLNFDGILLMQNVSLDERKEVMILSTEQKNNHIVTGFHQSAINKKLESESTR